MNIYENTYETVIAVVTCGNVQYHNPENHDLTYVNLVNILKICHK
jgi:hypothetical protein